MAVSLEAQISTEKKEVFDIHMIFSIIESNQIEASASITDHYVEDNTARQDHMSLAPLKYTLSGLVAEKVYQRKYEVMTQFAENTEKIGKFESVTKKLGAFSGLCPQISNYANVAVGAYKYAEASYNRYAKSIQSIKGAFNKNKVKKKTTTEILPMTEIEPEEQTAVFEQLWGFRNNRTLVYLKTPFKNFGQDRPFLIESVKMEQGDTKSMSRLTVTVKEYRAVSTKMVKIDPEQYAARVATNKALTELLGKVKGKEDIASHAYNITYGTWGDPTRGGRGVTGSW